MIAYVLGHGPYLFFVVLVVLGTSLLVSQQNLLKSLVGLYLFQTAVVFFFIALGFRAGGTVPILGGSEPLHSPLPHAMMLTAIVVGVATIGVAVAILRRIQAESGSIDESARGDDPGAGEGA